jgi:hypothetical protein
LTELYDQRANTRSRYHSFSYTSLNIKSCLVLSSIE